MHRNSVGPLLAPMLALGLLLSATVVAQNGPAETPQPQDASKKRGLKVGIVDIGVLFRDYKRKDLLETAVNEEREKIKKQLEDDADALLRLRKNFDKAPYVPNSPPWCSLRDEIKQAQFVYELKQERLQTQLKQRVEELTLEILTELQETIRNYGNAHGYDLILKSDDSDQTSQGELAAHFQERIFRAQISDMLYHSSAVDITETVKQALNDPKNLDEMEKFAARLAKERQQQQQAQVQPQAPPPASTEKKN